MHHPTQLTRYLRMAACGAALFACSALALPMSTAAAEGEEGEGAPDDLKAQIKAKIEKIIELMGKNEGALIELSTGGQGKTKRVDVEIPNPPSSSGSDESGTGNSGNSGGGTSGGGTSGSGSSGTEGTSGTGTSGTEGTSGTGTVGSSGGTQPVGAQVVRQLEELLKSQQSASGQIPGEIAELLRMIPEGGQGQGQGQGQGGEGSKPDGSRESGRKPRSAQPRDGTRTIDEQQEGSEQQGDPKNPNGKPENGADSPRDPNQRDEGAPEDPNDPKNDKRDDDIKAWEARLPPEYREFVAGGQVDKVPEEYRGLVRRYLKWLAKSQAKKKGR